MKHVSKLLALFIMAIALQNCTQKDEVNPSKEKVSFGFDLSAASSGRITSSSFEGTKIRMTIRKSTGETLLDMQPVDLITMGGSIISVPVELPLGDYKVTDFVLVNTSGVVTHATPKTGSIMAPLVQHVLERNFSVSALSANHVPMEVIEIANYAASDFGYTTFNLAVVHPLKIAVYTPVSGGGWKLARADAFVMAGTDTTSQRYKLLAKTDIISFSLDPDSTYTLLLKKNAYARYSMPFNYHHLIDSLNGQPLKLYLTPAFTFSVDDDELEGYFEGPTGSEIIVDWGDGSSTPYTLEGEGISAAYNHSYTSTGNYFITVTGDISTVTGFYSYYGSNVIKEINFDFLPELKDLRFGFNGYGPKVIDLTYNTKLIWVDVSIQRNMGSLLLPTINNISFIDVSGANKLTSAKLIVIIDKVYNAAVENNTRDGAFFLIKSLENGKEEMLRPLTPEALAKLRELRDAYGWFISPNP